MRKAFKVYATLFIVCICLSLAACGLFSPPPVTPTAKADADLYYELDLNGELVKIIQISDFIHQNGASDVSYSVIASNDCIELSQISQDNEFSVTAQKEGSAEVELKAIQLDTVKVSITIIFEIRETTSVPTQKPDTIKEFTLDLAGVDLQSKEIVIADYVNENAAPDITYSLSRNNNNIQVSSVLNGKFVVTGAIAGGSSVVTLRVLQNDETKLTVEFLFSVIETAPASYTVLGIANGIGYTMSGDSLVTAGNGYSFTILRLSGYTGTPSVAYTVGGSAGVALVPVESPSGTFTFTIPSDRVTGDIAIGVVSGFKARYSVDLSAIESGTGYSVSGAPGVTHGEAYEFVIVLLPYYSGVPAVSYTIGGTAGDPITPVQHPIGTFTFTIPAGKVTGEIVFASVMGIENTPPEQPDVVLVFSDALFYEENWTNNPAAAPSGTLLEVNGGLKFDGTNMRYVTNVPDELIKNNQTDKWPAENGTAPIGPYRHSFILKAEGTFKIGFLSNGNATPNEFRLAYDGNKLTLLRSVGGADVTFGTATDLETGFKIGQEFRFDIDVSAIKQKITTAGLVDLQPEDYENGVLKIEVLLDGEKIIFKNGGTNADIINTNTDGHYFCMEQGAIYIQRLNLSANQARYGNYFIVNTVSGGTLYLLPFPESEIDDSILPDSGGDAQFFGANPFYRNTWFKKDGGAGKPSTISVAGGGTEVGAPGVEFRYGDNYAAKIPYQRNQHFTFMLSTNGGTDEPIQFMFRSSDDSLAPAEYYHIGTSGTRIVFSKNSSDKSAWQAVVSKGLTMSAWHRVDVVFRDTAGKTVIKVYLDNQKLIFNASELPAGMTVENGNIIDTGNPIQSGDYLGFWHNRNNAGIWARIAPYAGPNAAADLLLKDAYAGYFPIGGTVQTGNTTRYQDAGLMRHFNSLTAEYEMKWSNMQKKEGVFNYTESDKLVSYAKQNGMKIRGHALVWYKSIPSWIFADVSSTPDAESKEKLLGRIRAHTEAVVKHFDDTVYCWDVVNEAVLNMPNASQVTSGNFYRTGAPETTNIGGWDWYQYCETDYIYEAFRAADRARTEAGLADLKLFYNDYNLMFANKRNAVVKMVQDLKEKNVPIDGIGMQSHFKYDTFNAAEFEKSVKAFAELGLDVQITELDISLYKSSESARTSLTAEEFAERSAVQHKAFEDIFRIARKYSTPQAEGAGRVTGVTFWGVADDASWLNNTDSAPGRKDYGLFFGRNFEKKSVFGNVVKF